MSEYHPDPDAAVETARRTYLEVRAAAHHQLDAMSSVPEVGTEAGDRYAALGHRAADAYTSYVATWSAAYPPEREAEAG
jgi:hypothetical protein